MHKPLILFSCPSCHEELGSETTYSYDHHRIRVDDRETLSFHLGTHVQQFLLCTCGFRNKVGEEYIAAKEDAEAIRDELPT